MLKITSRLKRHLSIIKQNIFPKRFTSKYVSEEEVIIRSIREAQEEMESKEKYFNHATDPDLVDYAIYDIETSKKKYNYLLKMLKKGNNM